MNHRIEKDTKVSLPFDARNARIAVVGGVHDYAPAIADSELRNRVSGRTFAEWLVARDAVDSQEARRLWRAGR